MSREAHVRFSEGVGVKLPRATRPSESLRRRPRGASRHRFLDDFLQFSTPSPGDEQSDADGSVARRHGQNRGGGEGCGYAASLGQRKRAAHIPTAETEAARSGLILEGQGQARLHLNFNDPWSHEWGPVHEAVPLTIEILALELQLHSLQRWPSPRFTDSRLIATICLLPNSTFTDSARKYGAGAPISKVVNRRIHTPDRRLQTR